MTPTQRSGLVLAVIAAFYSMAGKRRDLLGNAAFLGYLNRSIVTSYVQAATYCVPRLFLLFSIALVCYISWSSRYRPERIWQGPAQPYLIPCRTTHRRFFPTKHSFAYSYLVVGVPIGYKDGSNNMIEIDEGQSSTCNIHLWKFLSQSWYRILASDHFEKSQVEFGLRGKLDGFLESEGADPAAYPHAYLITAPRFMGYNFNPVSLWYLYSEDKTLSAMVLEVNNTYDERRSYLVIRESTNDRCPREPEKPSRIRGSPVKDFYVSPFNSREGTYSVLASDPLGTDMRGFRGLDVTITLNSPEGRPKLVARLFSGGQAIDPTTLGPLSRVGFLSRHFWIGFATLPRIIKEATFLLSCRKLRMVEKPDPLIRTLGRHATAIEETLEAYFRNYLRFLVGQSDKALLVRYFASRRLSATESLSTSSCGRDLKHTEILEIWVLTPAFYSRFIEYTDSLEAITAELGKDGTIWVNRPELLSDIFARTNVTRQSLSFLDLIFAKSVGHLRKSAPIAVVNSVPTNSPNLAADSAKRDDQLSSMDAYMILNRGGPPKWRYYWANAVQLVVSSHFTVGLAILQGVAFLIRIGIAWECASCLTQIMTRT